MVIFFLGLWLVLLTVLYFTMGILLNALIIASVKEAISYVFCMASEMLQRKPLNYESDSSFSLLLHYWSKS